MRIRNQNESPTPRSLPWAIAVRAPNAHCDPARKQGLRMTREGGLDRHTFEWNDEDLFLPVSTPLLDLPQSIDQHARIDNDNIGVLDVRGLTKVFTRALPCSRRRALLLLVVGWCGRGGDPDAADRQLATLRVGGWWRVWALAISPVIVAAVVTARGRWTWGRGRNGLFELLDLVSEECSTEGSRQGKLVRGGGALGLLIKTGCREIRWRELTLVSAMLER